MKKLTVVLLGVFLLCGLFFAGCDVPFNAPNNIPASPDGSLPEGMGKVRIFLNAGEAKTAYPTAVFDEVEYTFTKTGGSAQVIEPQDGAFILAAGSYTVSVKAKVGGEVVANSTEAAAFTVTAGSTSTVTVKVAPIVSEGQGSFTYTLTAPDGASLVSGYPKMTLVASPATTVSLNQALTGSAPSVNAGYYLFEARFTRDDEKVAYLEEIVHIYKGMATTLNKGVAEANFVSPGEAGSPPSFAMTQPDITFREANYGETPETRTVTVTNTGGSALALNVELGGTDASGFIVNPATLNINPEESKTFTVAPKAGLIPLDTSNGVKTYADTVTVSGFGVDGKSFNVSFGVTNLGVEKPYFDGFYYRDAAGANGGATNRQLAKEFLAYYKGEENVLHITPENKAYTDAFVNYQLPVGTFTISASMKIWVAGTGNPAINWKVWGSNNSATDIINTTVQPGQWVTISSTSSVSVTTTSDRKIFALHTGGLTAGGTGTGALACREFYISDVVITVANQSIALNQTGDLTFPEAGEGYGAQTPQTVTVTNTGLARTVTIGLSGTNASSFTVTPASLNLAAGGNGSFTVVPNTGLAAGIYTATVNVGGPMVNAKTFNVSFTVTGGGGDVDPPEPPPGGGDITLSQTSTHTFAEVNYGAASTARTVTVNNTGSARTVDIALSGTNAVDFSLSAATLSLPANGSASFTVTPKPKTVPGAHAATVTVSGTGVTTRAFGVSVNITNTGTESPYFDGLYYRRQGDTQYTVEVATEFLAYYQGAEQVLHISPVASTYTWGFMNYHLNEFGPSKNQNYSGKAVNITLSSWVYIENGGTIIWTLDGSSGTELVTPTTVPANTWTLVTGTINNYTVTSTASYARIGIQAQENLNNKHIYFTDLNVSVTQGSTTTNVGGGGGVIAAPPDSIALSGDVNFGGATAGYPALTPQTVTVTNTGAARAVSLALGGTGASSFTLSASSLGLPADGSAAFTVVPKTGLAEGTHNATVTAGGVNVDSKTINVSFTVNANTGGGSTTPPVADGVDPNFHIYLAFGQSNMVGPARIETQDTTGVSEDFRTMAVRAGTYAGVSMAQYGWRKAVPPLIDLDNELSNTSGPNQGNTVGLGPLDGFGRALTDAAGAYKVPAGVRIGVIGVAQGSKALVAFTKNNSASASGNNYVDIYSSYNSGGLHNAGYNAVVQSAKEAQKVGVIKGILVHQGESGSGGSDWGAMLGTIYQDMIADLGLNADDVPLLAGRLLNNGTGGFAALESDAALQSATGVSKAYVILTNGIPARDNNNDGNPDDGLHFGIEGVRELGKRYAEKIYNAHYTNGGGYTPPGGGLIITWSWNGTSLLPSTAAQTVTAGTSVNFTAATGFTRYEWYVNGAVVSGEVSNSYTFDTTGKSGKYNILVAAYDAQNNPVNGDKVVVTVN